MAYDYKNSNYVSEYVNEMTDRITRMHPEWDDQKVFNAIEQITYKRLQNPQVNLDNNYTHENKNASMLSVIDWVEERKPLIAGNGTFYKNQHEAMNPIANMLMGMLMRRKAFKKEMFKVEDAESQEYKDLDLKQANEKINCNS